MHLHIPILFRLLLLSGHEAKVNGLLLQMIWTLQLIYCMESMYVQDFEKKMMNVWIYYVPLCTFASFIIRFFINVHVISRAFKQIYNRGSM